MKVFILCGGHYSNFSHPKCLSVVKGERLLDRTIRLLRPYSPEITVTCNLEETRLDSYYPLKVAQSFHHIERKGYYLDAFIPCDFPCIYLFGDVFYTEDAIKQIIERFNTTTYNVFVCNKYPFNEKGLRQGEPFGWIVKDQEEFKAAITLCKKLQNRGRVTQDGKLRIPTNWELSQVINGNGVNQFIFNKDDCLVIDDLTIDCDSPESAKILEERICRSIKQ